MQYLDELNLWIENVDDAELLETLTAWRDENNEKAVEDAFCASLVFGTAGLRGTIEPGPNRMNIYTVAKATQGLANYLNANYDAPAVAIAHDSRHKGVEFTRVTAEVLAANNIRSYIYPHLEPTPALGFATQYCKCQAGVCITASHNPAPYNGYKVFNGLGCQITTEAADAIYAEVEKVDIFNDVKRMAFMDAEDNGLINWIDDACIEAFVDAALANVNKLSSQDASKLKLVYTPLNGAGLEANMKAFEKLGIENVTVVESQREPNGDFPTCPYPNPEIREAMEEGIKVCESVNPSLLLATDPDADREGLAINHNGEYVLTTGNEVGLLLIDYLCKCLGEAAKDKVIATTIVSSTMADALAKHYGFELRRTLTGFKYLGEQITLLEEQGKRDRFCMGFEESYGYLIGDHVRDKDSISASIGVCKMAAYYDEQGMDLIDAMTALYEQFGYYKNGLQNFAYPGAEGARKMAEIMQNLREEAPMTIDGKGVIKVTDYETGAEMPIVNNKTGEAQTLPKANVLQWDLDGDAKVIVRPSGTEPKIKVYTFVKGETSAAADATLASLQAAVEQLF